MSRRSSFRALRKFITPRWLTAGEGGLVGYALDLVKDAFVHRAYLGLLASMPEVAPPDANAATGRDRRVVPALVETRAEYAQRLIRWLDDRQTQGSPFMLLQKLKEYLGAGVRMRIVNNRGTWLTLNEDGTYTHIRDLRSWDWDGSGPLARWSRFWVIIYPTTVSPPLWAIDDPDWGDGSAPWGDDSRHTWGSDAPADQVQTVRAIISDWKALNERCVNIIVAFDEDSFDPISPEPDGTWEHWSKTVSGVRVPARLATARYWDGVS